MHYHLKHHASSPACVFPHPTRNMATDKISRQYPVTDMHPDLGINDNVSAPTPPFQTLFSAAFMMRLQNSVLLLKIMKIPLTNTKKPLMIALPFAL